MRIFVFLGFILTVVVFANSAALEEENYEGGNNIYYLLYNIAMGSIFFGEGEGH